MISIYNQFLSTASYVASTYCRQGKVHPDISTSSIELADLKSINTPPYSPKTEENSDVWKKRYYEEGLATVYEMLYERIGVHPLIQIIADYACIGKPKYPIDYEKVVLRGVTNLFGPNDYRNYFRVKMNARIFLNLWMKMRSENNQPHPTLINRTMGEKHTWVYIPPLKIQQIKSLRTRAWVELCVFTGGVNIPESESCCDDRSYWILMPTTTWRQEHPLPFEDVEKIVKEEGYQIPSLKEVLLAAFAWHGRGNEIPSYLTGRMVYTIHTGQLGSNRYTVFFRDAHNLFFSPYVFPRMLDHEWPLDIVGVRKFDVDGLEITSHA